MGDQPYRLAHTDKGSGPVVVLLHGFLESHTMWDYLKLDSKFRTISIDLPGHGLSKNVQESFSIEHLARCVKLTLDSLRINDFHLIGHSLGGYIALEFLSHFGCKGHSILLNSNFWQDDEKKQADRLRIANLVLTNKNWFVQEAIPGLFSYPDSCQTEIKKLVIEAKEIPAEHIASISLAMRNRMNHKATLIKEQKKVFILQGESDKLCSQDRMKNEVVGLETTLVCIPEAGHMSHIENTSFVQKAIFKILNDLD